jgi:sulfur-carrier protein
MKIHVFAILKDFYSENFEIDGSDIKSIEDLKHALSNINKSATTVLEACRFAVNEEFVNGSYQLNENEHVYIIPPSSGG